MVTKHTATSDDDSAANTAQNLLRDLMHDSLVSI